MGKPNSRSNSRSDSQNCREAVIAARILGAFFWNWGRARENQILFHFFVADALF